MLPTVVALGMCLWRIQARQVWRDEHSTWWAASLPLDALGRLLAHVDVVLAPYYLLMRTVVALLGATPWALRLPSALAVALSAGALALLGKRLFNPHVGALAGLSFAIVPSVSRYGQEARPYAFALLFAIGCVLLLERAVRRPAASRFAAYAVSVVCLGAAHLVALCSLAAHPVLVFDAGGADSARRWRAPLLGLGLSLLAAGLVLTPLLWLGAEQRAQVAWTQSQTHGLFELPRLLFMTPGVGRVILGLGLCALWRPSQLRLFAAAWAILPLAVLYLSQPLLHFFVHRYLLFNVSAWCLLAALFCDDLREFVQRRTRKAWLPPLIPLAVLAWIAASGWTQHQRIRVAGAFGERFDYVGLARELRARGRPDDAVAFAGRGNAPYWARMALQYELRDQRPLRDVFVQASAAEIGRFDPLLCEDPAACLPSDVERLWLVACTSDDGDVLSQPPRNTAALLRERFVVRQVTSLENLTLALLERTP